MINKNNWKLTKKYLEYRSSVDQLCIGSLEKEKVHLRYLLEWMQQNPFLKASAVRPTFPELLKSKRMDGDQKSLSPGYMKKVLATTRRFFSWLIDNQEGYKSIKNVWIETIKVKRLAEIPKQREAVSLEEILTIAHAPVNNLEEERIRASAVFLFLSGMRISAFISLPLLAVDIQNREVKQFPNLGVRTKNGKYAITNLLPIPELLKVVEDWDKKIRAILPPEGFWFAPFSPETCEIDPSVIEIGLHRESIARKNLTAWMKKNNLKYHSPHKFRHGHIQYGLAHSTSHADYKAVSMNVMHSSIQITDQFYSNITDNEIKRRIQSFGNEKPPTSEGG